MNKKDATHGVNALRIGFIEQALIKVYVNGLASEAELLNDEIKRLRRLAGIQFDANADLFDELKQKKRQPSLAAKARADKEKPYKEKLKEWAIQTYQTEQLRRRENGLTTLPKRSDSGAENAATWLLKLYNEDRHMENNPNQTEALHESGNIHGSPCPNGENDEDQPVKFKATYNFFYQSLKNL